MNDESVKPQQMTIFGGSEPPRPMTAKKKNNAPEESLRSAKARLAQNLDDGMACPCCAQFAKRYRRGMTAEMTRALFALFHAAEGVMHDEWVDVRKMKNVRGGDYAKLRYFGLIEAKHDPEKARERGTRTSGLWRVTKLGRDFIDARARVPSFVVVYDGNVVEKSSTGIDVRDALGKRFSYEKLMRGSS
jgi:hypothetical protein